MEIGKKKLVMMLWSLSLLMWRKADRMEWSKIEVDLQGDRCSAIIPGFRDGCSNDGEKRRLRKTVPDLNPFKRFLDRNREGGRQLWQAIDKRKFKI